MFRTRNGGCPWAGAVMWLCVASLWAGSLAAEETLLRTRWVRARGPEAEQFRRAQAIVDRLAERWASEPTLRADPMRDRDVRWLLRHRMPAYVALDARLAARPRGSARSVQLWLAGRIGMVELERYLPPLLADSTTRSERLEVLDCMAALHGRRSVAALRQFILSRAGNEDERLLATAVRGLGMTRQAEHLPLINAVRFSFRSPQARFDGAVAAFRCGQASAFGEIAGFLSERDGDQLVQRRAIAFLRDNFNTQALKALARFADSARDEDLAVEALRALIDGSCYGRRPPSGRRVASHPPAQKELAAPGRLGRSSAREAPPSEARAPGVPGGIAALSPEERRELIEKVTEWWEREGRADAEKRRRVASQEMPEALPVPGRPWPRQRRVP